MRGLTIWQPWASLIAAEIKPVEFRGRPTRYRGRLLIHAGVAGTRDQDLDWITTLLGLAVDLRCAGEFRERLRAADEDWSNLPRGFVLAVAELVDCQRAEALAAQFPDPLHQAVCNFDYGGYGWVLGDVRRLPIPVAARGFQGLWPVDRDLRQRVAARLAPSAGQPQQPCGDRRLGEEDGVEDGAGVEDLQQRDGVVGHRPAPAVGVAGDDAASGLTGGER